MNTDDQRELLRLERMEVRLLQASLDLMQEGIAVLDPRSNILYWNKTAALVTGYDAAERTGRPCPDDLFEVDQNHRRKIAAHLEAVQHSSHAEALREYGGFFARKAILPTQSPDSHESSRPDAQLLERPTLVNIHHKLGHTVPAMLHKIPLQDALATSLGAALLFYSVEELDALPHGESNEEPGLQASQADMEDRLAAAHHQWLTTGIPFGLMWISVDQAKSMRSTHGHDACEEMLRLVGESLLRQMNPGEVLGRWGEGEFLVITRARTTELSTEHAQRLIGIARTVDFRWWGDRVELTTSIGTTHTTEADTLESLLALAQKAMQDSEYAGGNQTTEARRA